MKNKACHEFRQTLLQNGSAASRSDADRSHAESCPDCQAVQHLAYALTRLGAEARNRDMSSRALADTRQGAAAMLVRLPHHAPRHPRLLLLPRWTWAAAALAATLLIVLRLPSPDPSVAPEPVAAASDLAPADMERNILALRHSLALDMRAFADRHRSPPASTEATDAAGRLRRQMDLLAFSVRLDLPDALASAHPRNGVRP